MTSYVNPFSGDVVVPTDVSYAAYSLTSNLQLIWPGNGSVSSNVAARIMDVTPSALYLNISMPPASQASVGTDALIRNLGSVTLNVLDADGGTITSIAAGEAKYIYLTNNSTSAGIWGLFTFGAGTSTADAGTLAGYGILASGLTLNQSHPTSTLGTGYTFQTTDRAQVQIWPTTGGAGTVTLPSASTLGDNWFVLLKNNGTGTLTLATTGGELLDGTASSKLFAPGNSAFVICAGTGFVTVGYGTSTQFAFTALTKPVTGGTYTLTASEASNTIQAYTGAITSNVTVYFPPVVNLYVISNQTTGSYTFSVGTATGIAVSIPSNTQATVICDGTNFYNANTTTVGGSVISMVNGSASNPSLYFASETNTGIYRPGGGQFGISILGNLIFNTTASGISVTGSGNFTTGISGGGF